MTPLTDKIDRLLDEIIHCDLSSDDGVRMAKKKIMRALKEQDRDTRHACSEAVVKCSFWSDAADCNVVRSDVAGWAVINCLTGINITPRNVKP